MEENELIFHDITDASRFTPEAPFPIWIIVLVSICILLIIAAIVFYSRKSPPAQTRENGYQSALNELSELKPKLGSLTLDEVAKHLSLITRNALKLGAGSPALYKTQQEAHSQEVIQLSDKAQEETVKAHLDQLWNLEYSPSQKNTPLAEKLYEETHALLTRLKTS